MEKGEWHALPVDEAARLLGTSPGAGLSEAEAAKRLGEFGPNELKAGKKRSLLGIFFAQFMSFLIFVLVAAALVSAYLGEWVDAVAIAAILVLNAALGTVQEYRAEKAIEALRRMTAPSATVLRGGRVRLVPSKELVPGDVIMLEAGNVVPADCRLAETISLEANEAALTGESAPARKDANASLDPDATISARAGMAFSGTTIASGRGKGVVVGTGMGTEFGKIATAVQEVEDEETPLKKSVEKIGKDLTVVFLVACAVVFAVGVYEGSEASKMFLESVALAVAAIPEGLPAVITIALAIGVQRMSRKNAIVRKLVAVETLGSANVICTDKTGTLTKNEMTARRMLVAGQKVDVEGSGYCAAGCLVKGGEPASERNAPGITRMLRIAALCNNSSVTYGKDGGATVLGDPTEAALLVLAGKHDVWSEGLKKEARFLAEVPFDSGRKMMSVVYDFGKEGPVALSKGAPEVLLSKCTHYFEGAQKKALTKEKRESILSENKAMAGDALRVLAFAERPLHRGDLDLDSIEEGLAFVGLVGMIDAPRDEVPGAVRLCREAGIEVVMVTGDNEETARAVGKEIGLMMKGDMVVTGAELEKMGDRELEERVEHIRVYARVSPEHKLRIVNAWKARGKIVAMTGDGVNDAPALKRADIGVAMGVTGTDVTKEVSDVVLADDNFASIVSAVKEGRGIYDNIRKCIAYLMSGNIAEVLIIFIALVLRLPLPLTAIQLLWINLVTDGLPALALAADPITEGVMKRKPRPRSESVWSGMGLFLLLAPILLTAFALALFAYLLPMEGIGKAQTVVFTLVIVFEKFVAFSSRDLEKPVIRNLLSNRWLLASTAVALALQVAIIYTPVLDQIFNTVPLDAWEWGLVIGLGAIGFAMLEAAKLAVSRLKNRAAPA